MAPTGKRVTHGRELFYICFLLMFLLIGLLSILGPGGYIEMRKAKEELTAQAARVDALQKSIDQQVKDVNALRGDQQALEAYLRKKGYAKKGDIVQEIEQDEPVAPPKPESRPVAPDSRPGAGGK